MTRGLAAFAVGLALLGASAASAAEHSTTTAFKMACAETGGEMAQALAAADSAGWAEIPASLMAEGMAQSSGLKVREIGSRAMVQDRKLLILIAGIAQSREGGSVMDMSLCAVAVFGVYGDVLKADMTRYFGASPAASPDGLSEFAVWTYVNGPKGRDFFDSMSSRKALRAMLDGKLNMLMVGEDKGAGVSMIMQMRPMLGETN